MLIRNHLLCPYGDCVAHFRKAGVMIRALIDEGRSIVLEKAFSVKMGGRLSYEYKLWVVPQKCPFCERQVEVVIDEKHDGRNVSLRLPK